MVDGANDSTFGADGSFTGFAKFLYNADFPKGFERTIKDLLVLSNGDLIVASANEPIIYTNDSPLDLVLFKVKSDGTVDENFKSPASNVNGAPGVSVFDFNRAYENAVGLAESPDGDILVAFRDQSGMTFPVDSISSHLTKFSSATGVPVAAYGSGGVAALPTGGCAKPLLKQLVRDGSDRLVLIASCRDSGVSRYRFELSRVDLNGQSDLSFGTQGWTIFASTGSASYQHWYDLQQVERSLSGEFLLSAFAMTNNNRGSFSIGRLMSSGALTSP
ncbi:MAG: hypothetical protein NDJ89_06735 [Oligoflexia bacterium]|nr:hypothetical protein [Oligoflexia bacterium]